MISTPNCVVTVTQYVLTKRQYEVNTLGAIILNMVHILPGCLRAGVPDTINKYGTSYVIRLNAAYVLVSLLRIVLWYSSAITQLHGIISSIFLSRRNTE